MRKLFYLGPEGTFSHRAAEVASKTLSDFTLEAVRTNADVLKSVSESGKSGDLSSSTGGSDSDFGIVAIENNVEGVVTPVIDALIENHHLRVIGSVLLDIQFDAYLKGDGVNLQQVLAHPHALAQCQKFIAKHQLTEIPTASNTNAFVDLQPNQVALAPTGIENISDLKVFEHNVADYANAKTRFLIVMRDNTDQTDYPILQSDNSNSSQNIRTILHFIPSHTGPGALLDVLKVLCENSLNLTELITRPIKAVDDEYGFVAVINAGPTSNLVENAVSELEKSGNIVRLIGSYSVEGI